MLREIKRFIDGPLIATLVSCFGDGDIPRSHGSVPSVCCSSLIFPRPLQAASIIAMETVGGRFVFGVYQTAIQQDMGWGRSVLSLALAIASLVQGLSSPFWGMLLETFQRPAATMLLGAAFFISGNFLFAAAPQISSQAAWIAGVGILTGLGTAGAGLTMLMAEVGRYFPAHDPAALRKRSIIFGTIPSIGQAGQFIFAPVARSLISEFGWTRAAEIMAYQALVVVPLIFVLRGNKGVGGKKKEEEQEEPTTKLPAKVDDEETARSKTEHEIPEDLAPTSDVKLVPLSPTSATTEPSAKPQPTYISIPEPPSALLALKEAFMHPPYVFLTLAYFTCGWHVGFLSTSLVASLEDRGLDKATAAWCLSAIGIGSMFGTFLAGFLPSIFKIRIKWLLASVYYSRAIFLLIFILIPSPPNAAATLFISVLLGLSWLSTVPPTTSLTASILGTRWLGTLSGVSFGVHQIGGFLGTYLGAVEYDASGSYKGCYWASVGLAVLAGGFVTIMGDRTLRRREIDYLKLDANEATEKDVEDGKGEASVD